MGSSRDRTEPYGASIKALESVLGFSFKNPSLLRQALMHLSYCNEHGLNQSESYERLEFLGDAVLELAVSTELYLRFPDADEVVVAVDPRGLPSLAPLVERTMPAIPPVVCHVGLEGDVPDLPHEVVLHGDPLLVVRTGGHAPDGRHAWTIHGRGKIAEELGVEVRVRSDKFEDLDKETVKRLEGLGSRWCVLTRDKDKIKQLDATGRWHKPSTEDAPLWTDTHTSLLPIFILGERFESKTQ